MRLALKSSRLKDDCVPPVTDTLEFGEIVDMTANELSYEPIETTQDLQSDQTHPQAHLVDSINYESDTSEVIHSCLCKGTVFSRDCILCDGPEC